MVIACTVGDVFLRVLLNLQFSVYKVFKKYQNRNNL
jgi:hypothetical protein